MLWKGLCPAGCFNFAEGLCHLEESLFRQRAKNDAKRKTGFIRRSRGSLKNTLRREEDFSKVHWNGGRRGTKKMPFDPVHPRNTFTRDEFDWFALVPLLAYKVHAEDLRATGVDPRFIPGGIQGSAIGKVLVRAGAKMLVTGGDYCVSIGDY